MMCWSDFWKLEMMLSEPMHIHDDRAQNDLMNNDRGDGTGPALESPDPGDVALRLS